MTTVKQVKFGSLNVGDVFARRVIGGELILPKTKIDPEAAEPYEEDCPDCGADRTLIINMVDNGRGHKNHFCDNDLVWTIVEGEPHRYYFLNRPPSIGTHPTGEINRELWYPVQDIPGTERHAWGWVEYPEALEYEQVWKYELFPHGDAAIDAYFDWRDEVGK